MQRLSLALRMLAAVGITVLPKAALAVENTTLNYTVLRNGDRIGASSVHLERDGGQMRAEVATHVQVKIAYVTVYRYDQHETERWADGRLLALNAVTDDNGTVYRVDATKTGDSLSVDADGHITTVDPAVTPISLWNAALIEKTQGLDPKNGKVTPVSVVDRGEDQVLLQGHATTAHHYSIKTGFAQDVWYDQQHRLVKVELHAVDGSTIQYRLG